MLTIWLVSCAVEPASAGPLGTAQADCEGLAERAGAEIGLPPGLLTAISRVEAGRTSAGGETRAWPWTLNQGGDGSFHDTREAALAHAHRYFDTGITNVDLGCMQLNWRWHRSAFQNDAAAMIDPVANTRYAAALLMQLYDESGSWRSAIANYHSRDKDRGAAYADKVEAVLSSLNNVSSDLPETSFAAMRFHGILVSAPGSLFKPASKGLLSAGTSILIGRRSGDR